MIARAGRTVAMLALITGCAGSPDSAANDTSSLGGGTGPGAVALELDGVCPANGLWARCSILKRLEQAGLVPRPDSEPVHRKPLLQTGMLVHVGRSDLQLFIYQDSSARADDEARLDKSDFVSGQQVQSFRAEPTLIRSANLLAILDSRSETQRERVWLAITAGPPQPDRSEE